MGLLTGLLLQPGGIERLSWVYDHFVPLLSASVAMSLAQAGWVYAYSFFSGELLALGGNSGRFFYDFWMGRPLNPTFPGFPSFDIKTFNEVRPGIIGWVVLNVACACEQYLRQGRVSDSMWLVIAFEGYYAADCLYSEVRPPLLLVFLLRDLSCSADRDRPPSSARWTSLLMALALCCLSAISRGCRSPTVYKPAISLSTLFTWDTSGQAPSSLSN